MNTSDVIETGINSERHIFQFSCNIPQRL